ncbi:MAG: DUF2334 domain-containing protein [Lachnospiraceae bacterium]|nr:DUF2334 domain-containing protein [Lachnospiraceae bacterium]
MAYYIRLDDACEKRNIEKWDRIEALFDKYGIKPLIGVIPHCEDPMMGEYETDDHFWDRVHSWTKKGWTMALHGYSHKYTTNDGGLNPVNKLSEFAGVPLEEQKEKIKKGVEVFRSHNIEPQVFFSPAHTFDMNTLEALRSESDIRIISDTVADKPYSKWGFTFIPQQSGNVRKLPFSTVTFCYHPNEMNDNDFDVLEKFLSSHKESFKPFPAEPVQRKYSLIDKMLSFMYFVRRR